MHEMLCIIVGCQSEHMLHLDLHMPDAAGVDSTAFPRRPRRISHAHTCVLLPLCSVEVEQGLMALLRMGVSAAAVHKELFLGVMREVNSLLDTLPTEGSSAVPTGAQVLRFRRHLHAPLQLFNSTPHPTTAFVAQHRWCISPACCITLLTRLVCLLTRLQRLPG